MKIQAMPVTSSASGKSRSQLQSPGAQSPPEPGLYCSVGSLLQRDSYICSNEQLALAICKVAIKGQRAFIRKALGAAISGKIIASASLRPRKMYCCLCVRTAARLGFSVSSTGDVGRKGTASTENYMAF